jgi:hypothetical protein
MYSCWYSSCASRIASLHFYFSWMSLQEIWWYMVHKMSQMRGKMSHEAIHKKQCHVPHIIDESMMFWAAKEWHDHPWHFGVSSWAFDQAQPKPNHIWCFFHHRQCHVADTIFIAISHRLLTSSTPWCFFFFVAIVRQLSYNWCLVDWEWFSRVSDRECNYHTMNFLILSLIVPIWLFLYKHIFSLSYSSKEALEHEGRHHSRQQ